MESNQKPFFMIYSVAEHISIRFGVNMFFFFFFSLPSSFLSSFTSFQASVRSYISSLLSIYNLFCIRREAWNSRWFIPHSRLKCLMIWVMILDFDTQLQNTLLIYINTHIHRFCITSVCRACVFVCMLSGYETLHFPNSFILRHIVFRHSKLAAYQSFFKSQGTNHIIAFISSPDKDILLINRHSLLLLLLLLHSNVNYSFSAKTISVYRFNMWGTKWMCCELRSFTAS